MSEENLAFKPRSDSITEVSHLINQRAALHQQEESLRRNKSLATVAFFDLVGSTDFRLHRGAEEGLIKAYRHNALVSDAIRAFGGFVVKWMGDGVLGCFAKDDDLEGVCHSYRALRAAVQALRTLAQFNASAKERNQHLQIWDEVHTKVGICSGLVHYIALTPEVNQAEHGPTTSQMSLSTLDPMGSCVDIASRFQSLASSDTIVVEENTFWGRFDKTLPIGSPDAISRTPEQEVNWRQLKLDPLRQTVYTAYTSPFFITSSGLLGSRRAGNGSGVMTYEALIAQAKDEAEARFQDSSEQPLFVLKPVNCNIRGVSRPLRALAVTLEPELGPIKHAPYQPKVPETTNKLLAEAEREFDENRDGTRSRKKFLEVLTVDPRNVRAGIYLALLARREGDFKGALQFLERALEANADCGMVWKLIGMTHLQKRLAGGLAGGKEDLDGVIIALTQAMHKASEQFDFDMERCCQAFLSLAYYLRGEGEDQVMATAMYASFSSRHQTPLLQFMDSLLCVLNHISNVNAMDSQFCEKQLESARVILNRPETTCDSLLDDCELECVLEQIRHRFKVAEVTRRQLEPAGERRSRDK